MDVAAERAYPTPFVNSPLLPLLLFSLATQKHAPDGDRKIQAEYDYIIVGAGTAGSVMANRLSEVPCVNVLLLEAGKRPPLLTDLPVLSFEGTDIDWNYKTAAQKYTGRGLHNREVPWPSGKVLGGSSVLNAMFSIRGNKRDYDNWAAHGADGWSYEEVLPYFKKMEDNQDPEYLVNGYHGHDGPLTVHKPWHEFETKKLIFEAGSLLGYSVVDANGRNQTGFYDFQAHLRIGQRCSSAKAYLVPAEHRPNLDILPNAMVRKVVIRHHRATGVLFDIEGHTYEVRARKEIILSSGAINSPQLLMLSGIGPRAELERHNISVIADLPVGKNLQDHCGTSSAFVINPIISPEERRITNPDNIKRYIQERRGPLAAVYSTSTMAFLNNHNRAFPNYLLQFSEHPPGMIRGMKETIYQQVYAPYRNEILLHCFAVPLNPKSRGSVTLHSNNPYDPPVIDPNYFEDINDIRDMVEGLKMCKKIANSEPLRRLGARPLRTLIPGCEVYAGNEDEYFECQARSFVSTLIHPTGTAKMGNPLDRTTVVDPELRVKGIQGLRVVDASIMPFIPSGNTNDPTTMVAEKASDIIKRTIECRDIPPVAEELLDLDKLQRLSHSDETNDGHISEEFLHDDCDEYWRDMYTRNKPHHTESKMHDFKPSRQLYSESAAPNAQMNPLPSSFKGSGLHNLYFIKIPNTGTQSSYSYNPSPIVSHQNQPGRSVADKVWWLLTR